MTVLRVTEVFTPGAFPTHTYIAREEQRLEDRLRDALDTPGQIVSLSGPSKSGKTVLVERVVGRDNLITVTGASIASPEEIWDRVLDWMESPSESSREVTWGGTAKAGAEAKGGLSLPFVGKGEVAGKGEIELSRDSAVARVFRRRGMAQVIDEIKDSEFVVLLDDFHYMPRTVQEEVAKQIKEAARLGVKIVTAAVTHRADDVVRANPELRGRVMAVDLSYWTPGELREIATLGFGLLKMDVSWETIASFASEAAGSPQLMQAICLNACFDLGVRVPLPDLTQFTPPADARRASFERTAATTDFRSLVDVLDGGPKTRGTERRTYKFVDGTEGDVYRCVLKAVALDPPRLSFDYDEIQERVARVCVGERPVGSSVVGSCSQMAKLASEFPRERVVDWDETKQVLDIPDPYLVFYLRWSGRLLEPES